MNEFDFLDDGAYEAGEESAGGYIIDNDSKADWAIKKIAAAKAEYERLEALAEEETERIKEQLEAAKKRFVSDAEFYKSKLAAYFDRVEHKSTKTQETYQLLSGKLVRKYGAVKPSYDDTEMLDYLKGNGLNEFVAVTEKPAWGEYKKRLTITEAGAVDTETGEMIPCIQVEKQPDTFDVKI